MEEFCAARGATVKPVEELDGAGAGAAGYGMT